MSDWPDPTKLKTGVGKTLAADEFYWQDYLGKDYAVRAIQLARKYGNATDKLFQNDYGLENADQKKCLGLIEYVKYDESKGVTVDRYRNTDARYFRRNDNGRYQSNVHQSGCYR